MKWVWIVLAAIAAIGVVVAAIGAMLPQSHTATRSARFRRSTEEVFAVVTGPPEWRSSVKEFGTLPNGNTWEVDSSNERIEYQILENTPPNRYVTKIATQGIPYGGGWEIEITPIADGSTIRVTENGEVYNVIFRFVSRFIIGHTSTIETYLQDLGRKFNEDIVIES